ncbi:MAG TPA: acyltransferase [Candidatus Paceibacterota bacterium]|nr:acyltransferase [Candidatus Paceibacterota bacterium]
MYTGLNEFKNIITKTNKIVSKKGSVYALNPTAKIELNGNLTMCANTMLLGGNERSAILRMDEHSILKVNGDFSVFYGGDIIIFHDAILEVGKGFINSDVKIRCFKHIKIGQGTIIAHDVTIIDTDAHKIGDKPPTQEIIIGDHVWIGMKATILKGVHIGNGAMIAAGAVVTRDIPANCLAAGVPARVIKENIKWG